MTVNTTTSRADYTGNGVTTAFTVPFYFLDNTHLTVLRTVIATGVSTTLILGTDYSVTGAGVPAGGTVTCTVAPTAAQKISILRNVPFTQQYDYIPNDPFPAESHERALDQLTMLSQQVNENLSRAITLPAATTGVSTALPTAQPLQLLGFNGSGNALTTYDPSSLLTVAGSSGFSTQSFNGTGAQTAFTLSVAPGAIANLEVFISGVRQRPTTDYTLSGTTLTFVSGAPAAGTGNIFVRWGTTLGIGVPNDASVTTAKIVDANVTTAKIADANVTTAKIADGAVTPVKLANAAAYSVLANNTNASAAPAAVNIQDLYPQSFQVGGTVAANALTATLQPTPITFRSATAGSGSITNLNVSTALSLTVPSGATLGTANGVAATLALAAINNAGTVEYAINNVTGLSSLASEGIINTTALSASSNSANTWYSTTARTGVPYKLVGVLTSTQTTAGTYATAPSSIQGYGIAQQGQTSFNQTLQGSTVASTSGTAIDFTGIPPWVKRITIVLNGVSTNGSSNVVAQLGTSGGIVATGYNGSAGYMGVGSGSANFTTGVGCGNNGAASYARFGILTWVNITGNTWVGSYFGGITGTAEVGGGGGNIVLGGTLDRIRITTVNGTDTFDAGSIGLFYE